jgi:uncharacterized circularly permuted ATP-grasp superfamily protein
MNQGITFTVYSDEEQGIERIFPFDINSYKNEWTSRNRNYTTIKSPIYFRRHL